MKTARRKAAKAARGTDGGKTLLVNGPCQKCGVWFTARSSTGEARYCSTECRGQKNYRTDRHKRRALERGAFVEIVDRAAIRDRDGWICGICGDSVDPAAKYPDLMSASLDHIVPLAAGGTHEPSNCQCAHWLCNSLKGADEAIDFKVPA